MKYVYLFKKKKNIWKKCTINNKNKITYLITLY